jgi:hypothetical protein
VNALRSYGEELAVVTVEPRGARIDRPGGAAVALQLTKAPAARRS